uniref:Uncharacterized protein LOC105634088 n=1 Tax=Rhizophora mucronata TaxID=61149 RepID=A0A2P2JRL3_RHIMU
MIMMNRDMEQGSSAYRQLSPNSWGTLEESVEKKLVKLQETGEWIANKTEKELYSSGKGILMFVFQWVLPAYIFFFLVACGVVKLPFSTPLLDDLLT